MDIDRQQVIAELERLLAAPAFRSRKLIKRFLRYAVQETLAGRGDQLNQYTIAVNALGKPEDFSPVYNPVVRIEAGRLRKLLEEYYAAQPQSSSCIISMPRGAYQVEFIQPHIATQNSVITESFTSRVTEGPRLFVHFQTPDENCDSSTSSILYKLRGDLLLALSRFRNIRLVSSASLETQQTLTQEFLQQTRHAYRADYLLNCDIYPSSEGKGNSFNLRYTLAHTLTDEIIWSDQMDIPAQPAQHDVDTMCRWLVANAISLHSGAVLRHWAEYQLAQHTPLQPSLKTLIYYLAFLRNISADTFRAALKVSRQRLQEFPDDAKAQVILARLCGYDHTLQYNLISNLEDEWTQAARMAIKLDPGNAEAHSVFAHNSYYRGDHALSLAELETARQANPYDTACEFLYGMGLCLLGKWDKGMDAIQQIMEIRFNHPPWYHVLPFLNAFNRKNYAEAMVHAERIQDFSYWGDMARAITLYRIGNQDRAFTELQQLLKANPALMKEDQWPERRQLSSHQSLTAVWATMKELHTRFMVHAAQA